MPEKGKTSPGVLTLRRPRGGWMTCVPWVVMISQCLVILILLLDPIRRECHHCVQCSAVQEEAEEEDVVTTGTQEINDRSEIEDFPFLHATENSPRVFYNRVPKCGSSTMMDLIIEMSKTNNFTFARAPEYMRFSLDDNWQKKFTERFQKVKSPMIYERHLHFLDFRKYGVNQPIYLNLVRDPMERLTSWYYFRRYQNGHIRDMPTNHRVRTYDECVLGNYTECVDPLGGKAEEGYFKIIPFFCGQEDFCKLPGDRSLMQAIHNVKKYYSVVGIMENYTEFVDALEFVLPKYFKGAAKVYKKLEAEWKLRHKTTYKLPTSPEARSIMMTKLKQEYQFYDFLKRRFKKMMNVIKASKSNSNNHR